MMMPSATNASKLFSFKIWVPSLNFTSKTLMDSSTKTLQHSLLKSSTRSPPRISIDATDGPVTLQEWQGWGSASTVPIKVLEIIEDLRLLETAINAQMSFGGNGGKLQGDFKIVEDKKHRATYQALDDSESKLQFYSARQVACRLLGSRGYLCQKCWLPLEEDCMCSRVNSCSLGPGIKFWLYMHPKDFLRQNNTGKLLWQVFGVQSATLCLYGIAEHEEMMWNALKLSGKDKTWCLYPNKNAETKSVQEAFSNGCYADPGHVPTKTDEGSILNFILIDGTWSNSGAMFRRLKEQAKLIWGHDLLCISLAAGASTMHKLRPQPSWDRTCTAGAAIGLLSELQLLPDFSSERFDRQAEALECALLALLKALTSRRLRMGRSVTRKVRHNRDIC